MADGFRIFFIIFLISLSIADFSKSDVITTENLDGTDSGGNRSGTVNSEVDTENTSYVENVNYLKTQGLTETDEKIWNLFIKRKEFSGSLSNFLVSSVRTIKQLVKPLLLLSERLFELRPQRFSKLWDLFLSWKPPWKEKELESWILQWPIWKFWWPPQSLPEPETESESEPNVNQESGSYLEPESETESQPKSESESFKEQQPPFSCKVMYEIIYRCHRKTKKVCVSEKEKKHLNNMYSRYCKK